MNQQSSRKTTIINKQDFKLIDRDVCSVEIEWIADMGWNCRLKSHDSNYCYLLCVGTTFAEMIEWLHALKHLGVG